MNLCYVQPSRKASFIPAMCIEDQPEFRLLRPISREEARQIYVASQPIKTIREVAVPAEKAEVVKESVKPLTIIVGDSDSRQQSTKSINGRRAILDSEVMDYFWWKQYKRSSRSWKCSRTTQYRPI